jgi:hypothetical protein
MKLDKKITDYLAENAKQATTGKLTVRAAKSRIYLMQQYLAKIETSTTTETVEIVEDDISRKLRRDFKSIHRKQRAAEADALKDAPAARKKIMSALYAQAGNDPGFADEILKALQRGDLAFFKTVMAAMETTKKIKARRVENQTGPATEPNFAAHAIVGHLLLERIERTGGPTPKKKEMENVITTELKKIDLPAFVNESDWGDLWKYLGVSDAEQVRKGRSGTGYTGKGRLPKGWDV